jgi:acyl carrier protein phosphodiesterase
MNFLAHIYLSGDNEPLMLGNFIADTVKGKQIEKYSSGIQQGIRLHRLIDEFTDKHPVVLQSKERLYARHHKFAGVIVDILYDHFLAKDFANYSSVLLPEYARNIYRVVLRNYLILPARSQRIIPFLMMQNWLTGYADLVRLQRIFENMSRRSQFESGMEVAVESLQKNYDLFQQEFDLYFPQLIRFCEEQQTTLFLRDEEKSGDRS